MDTPQARIVIDRPSGLYRDTARSYVVTLDGARRGTVRAGAELVLDVPPGMHRVQARIDWAKSEELVVDVQPGAGVRVIVEPGGGAMQFWQAFTGQGYLRLRQV